VAEASSIPAGGVYIALFHLAHARRIRVGQLGTIVFPASRYAYVGTAQRNLLARLSRHGRRRKPLKWHIDYLSVRAEMIGAIVIEGPKSLECRLATALVHDGAEPIRGFGRTDCRCQSHLFRLGSLGACTIHGEHQTANYSPHH
jgi:sugar fermentation stimulation protein A